MSRCRDASASDGNQRATRAAQVNGPTIGNRPMALKGAVALIVAACLGGCASVTQTTANGLGKNNGAIVVETADQARDLAREAAAAGDADRALYLFVQAVRLDPEDCDSFYAIGAIHERKGNTELAVRAYTQAVAADPSFAAAHLQLGALQLKTRDIDAARASLEAAIEADPSLWRAHNLLGVAADMEEHYEDAIAHYSAAIALQPSSASTLNNRGYSKYLAGMLDAAEADFLLALQIDATYQRAWQNLGLVFAREGQYDEARRAMEKYVPKHVAANDVGYVAMLGGDYKAAALLFQEAIRLSPRYYPTAAENVAELERRRGSQQQLIRSEGSASAAVLPE